MANKSIRERTPNQKLLAQLPSITILLQHQNLCELLLKYPENYLVKCLRQAVAEIRSQILSGRIVDQQDLPDEHQIMTRVSELVKEGLENKIKRVVNAAGVILHTGLGRATLPPAAQEALHEAAERYCLLATDRESGKRGDRYRHTDELLCELTGAEASLVVNNNSAAVMLALNTFGLDRESIVSRGELVEIGGAFRVPDVMKRSNTIMVEVGTTNKTHLRDYSEAITGQSSILLKVHTSNYRIEGFHQEVGIAELSGLAKERGLIVVMDLGSGALVDIRRWGLAYEPTVPEAVADGADVCTFSGDKMLGGPQCGIIVGQKELIQQMSKNPLMRAFRCGKLTLSALNGTLRCFLEPDKLPEIHPVYAMIGNSLDLVKRRANRLSRRLKSIEGLSKVFEIATKDDFTEMGSGSLPARGIPTRVVALKPLQGSAERIGQALRMADTPIFTRLVADQVIMDARTITDQEISLIIASTRQVVQGLL